MVRPTRAVESALLAKGMQSDQNHHTMFRMSIDGVTTLVTRISHGSNEIGDDLGKRMASQCGLQLREFWALVDCTLDQAGWTALVAERFVGGRNPFMNR